MLEIRASLREVGDRVPERGPRATEPGELGEDVPDPVALLPARSNLGERGGEARVRLVLRLDVAIQAQLSHRLLGAARWAQGLLERLGEGEELGVGLVQVDLLAEGLANLVGGRVVELDAVVLGVEEVDAARDP